MDSNSSDLPFLKDSSSIIHKFHSSQFFIGRNPSCHLDIKSTVISRQQCVICNEGNKWKIKNLSSLMTTLLNNSTVESTKEIKSGDKISFVNYPNDQFVFFSSEQDYKRLTGIKKRKLNPSADLSDNYYKDYRTLQEAYQTSILKNHDLINKLTEMEEALKKSQSETTEIKKALKKREIETSELEEALKESRCETSYQREKEKEFLSAITILEANNKDLVESCSEKMATLKESIDEIERLAKERNELARNDQKHDVVGEFSILDHLYEGDKLIDYVEFESLRNDVDKKNYKINILEQSLQKLTVDKDRIIEEIKNLLEQEFSCCVCSDILYEATILNCKHTFCYACLTEWKKTKKECPECRTKIKHETRNLRIDNFIEVAAPYLGESFMEKRSEIIRERRKVPTPSSHRDRATVRRNTSQRTPARRNNSRRNQAVSSPFPVPLRRRNQPMSVGPVPISYPVEIIDLTSQPR